MSKTQVLAIVGSLLIGTVVCAGILAVTLGPASTKFWPALGTNMVIVAIVTALTQKARRGDDGRADKFRQ